MSLRGARSNGSIPTGRGVPCPSTARKRNDWRYEKASLICLQSAIEGRLKEFGDQPVQSGVDQRLVPSVFEASRKSV